MTTPAPIPSEPETSTSDKSNVAAIGSPLPIVMKLRRPSPRPAQLGDEHYECRWQLGAHLTILNDCCSSHRFRLKKHWQSSWKR